MMGKMKLWGNDRGSNSQIPIWTKIFLLVLPNIYTSRRHVSANLSIIMSDHGLPNGGPETNGANRHTNNSTTEFDAIVIGAGFGGLRMLYELRKQGLHGRVFESGSGVGGV